MALTTFVGQNLGAKQEERTRKGARFGILAAVILAELIGVGGISSGTTADRGI